MEKDLWITITDRQGVIQERWFTNGSVKQIHDLLDSKLVLAVDPDDYSFLTD